MKLRFRKNSLRLRLNRLEVAALASGLPLQEQVLFPGENSLAYVLEASASAQAVFQQGVIRVSAPRAEIGQWASGDAIGIYFELPANGSFLKVAIEKDLACLDGPTEERDPDAFPRDAADGLVCQTI